MKIGTMMEPRSTKTAGVRKCAPNSWFRISESFRSDPAGFDSRESIQVDQRLMQNLSLSLSRSPYASLVLLQQIFHWKFSNKSSFLEQAPGSSAWNYRSKSRYLVMRHRFKAARPCREAPIFRSLLNKKFSLISGSRLHFVAKGSHWNKKSAGECASIQTEQTGIAWCRVFGILSANFTTS